MKTRAAFLAGITALTFVVSACAATEPTDTPSQAQDAAPRQAQDKADDKQPEMTSGQENALESARSYIELSGFSKKGLIAQLSS